MRTAYETRLARRVTELLERTVGFGKVRVEVRADMDFSQVVVNSEAYDPTGQVLRSSEAIEESATSQEAGQDAVTVGNNLPDAAALDGGAGGSSEQETRTEERSNYEISKTMTNRVTAPGEVERLSVAVLVDGLYNEGEGGAVDYEPRPQEQMQQLEALVRSAVGFDNARGDAIELVNMHLSLALRAGAGAESETQMITDQSYGAGGEAGVPATTAQEEEGFDSMIDIAHIEGRVKASSMKKIGEIIEKHPEEAVAILRTWMYQDAS